jgi:hypothetical protein
MLRSVPRTSTSLFLATAIACSEEKIPCTSPARSPIQVITSGAPANCVLVRDGSIRCWGVDRELVTAAPTNAGFIELALGGHHGCALDADGKVLCWGEDVREEEIPAERFRHVSAMGYAQSCGVTMAGELKCWFFTDYVARLAEVTPGFAETVRENMEEMNRVPPGSDYQKIRGYWGWACAQKTDGRLTCWGPYLAADPELQIPEDPLCDFAVAGNFGCAVTNEGDGLCWGARQTPEGSFSAVAAYVGSVCFIRADDAKLECRGTLARNPPADTFQQLSVSGEHACGVTTDDRIVCWGENEFGEAEVPEHLRSFGSSH